MSKYLIGKYEDGSPKHMYFKRRKHRVKRYSIRYYMYKAYSWKFESCYLRKYGFAIL